MGRAALLTFGPLFVPAHVRAAVSDEAWLDAMLDVERALANALSLADAIPAHAAAAIAEHCDPALYDLEALCEEGRAVGNPAEPLARELRERVGGDEARYVRSGVTSEDVLDSAMMVVARNGLALVAEELAELEELCGRRGADAAAALAEVGDARARLLGLRLPFQLGGHGSEVRSYFAAELELEEPATPWYGDRTVVAELGAALDRVAAVCEKIAPAMPGGANARTSLACACARGVHAQVTLLAGAAEAESRPGARQAEWGALGGALALAGGAVAATRESFESSTATVEAR